jgi:hypothetical protein
MDVGLQEVKLLGGEMSDARFDEQPLATGRTHR